MMDSPEARALVGVPWLFSRQGLAVLALVTVVAATFLATDITFLAGALVLVGLGARAWAILAFARVTYTRQTSLSRAFCGDDVMLESTLANPRPLPLPWVEVWEQLPVDLGPEGANERSFAQPDRVWVSRGLALWPYQRLRWRRRLACRHRGVFRLGVARLRTGDPFGFFVRDYRAGDPPRLIHWPTTARRGSLQVRVLEPATSLHVSLLLDARGFTFGIYHDELLELTLSALASIAVFLQGQGAPVALHANTTPPLVVPPGASVPHLQHILESLARLESHPGPALVPWALDDLGLGNTVVVGTSEVTPDLERSIAQLEAAGFQVLLLLAMNNTRSRSRRRGTISITPDCDLAARLEGRA
jgi:uncharacterized protein (DUF58 family)